MTNPTPEVPEPNSQDLLQKIGHEALNLVKQSADLETLSKGVEVAKTSAEAAKAYSRSDRILVWVAAISPFATVLVALAAILVQNVQNQRSLDAQRQQVQDTIKQQAIEGARTATMQRETSEDAQWRDALKLVSLRDSNSSAIGAFAMQGFFDSKRYGPQALTIASTLLTNVSNVKAFDAVFIRICAKVKDSTNLADVIALAQSLGLAQRAKYHITGAASSSNTPFLIEHVDRIYLGTERMPQSSERQVQTSAWELDTTSHYLSSLWRKSDHSLSPAKIDLTGVVLENAHSTTENFNNLDFSGVNFQFAILYNASFENANFRDTKLIDTYLRNVYLSGADFSGATDFAGSRWEGTNWWLAKCISPGLLKYLRENASPTDPRDKKLADSYSCH
jgi:hypothetical protein